MNQPEPFGKYLLLGQIAVGGMAEIYKARYADPTAPQYDIALKRILPSYTEDESFVTMFKDEGNIAIRLKHPNIVQVYEVGEVNNDWYIAMEYIHGTDIRILSDACDKYGKRFTHTQIARIACETAKALDYAHKCTDDSGKPMDIVHRDCTPHNIMVSHSGEVKLMDFGIARAASRATKTRVGTVKGKSSYMSPEQARGKQLDGRSDMFTLGTVIWELLTGYRLFKASSDFDILTKVLKAELIHPSDIDSKIPRDLGDIIMKTLERDRDLRYSDCGEMARALENWITMNGDRSDSHLGDVVLCLTNKQGHSFSELQQYTPGVSLYDYVDGNFIRKGGAAPVVAPAPATFSPKTASLPADSFRSPAPSYPQAGFPDPSVGGQQPISSHIPLSYIISFIVLFLISGIAITASILASNGDDQGSPTFVIPKGEVNIKSSPDGATVRLNGEPFLNKDGEVAKTPIYSFNATLGEKYTLTFEKKGYETVTVERNIVLLKQDIEVSMMTEEEAQLAKLDGFPKFTITTEPEGAKVKINGEDKGTSPVTLENLKYGQDLKIEVAMDGKTYQPTTQDYVAVKGSNPQLHITLDKVETAVAVAHPAPAAPTAQPNKASNNKQPAGPAKPGTINVKAVPWATVNIDSARVGTTPIKKDGLKPGSHKVELKLPSKNKSVTKTVNLKSGQNITIEYDFTTDKWK